MPRKSFSWISQYKRWVEVAWQRFQPQLRDALDQPVAYKAVFYNADGNETQRRLQGEFHGALASLDARRRPAEAAHILTLPRRI